MTFREKLQMEHPWMNETITDVVIEELCPCDLGYEIRKEACHHYRTDEECINCWNREMPNTEFKQVVSNPPTQEVLDELHKNIKTIPQSEVDAYNQGHADGMAQGMNDAWEFVKTCLHMEASVTKRIFGYEFVIDILENYTPQEALAKLKAYEEAQNEICVGDVVTYSGERGMVLDSIPSKYVVLTHDGWVQEWYECDVEKTGKHINFTNVLEQIGE